MRDPSLLARLLDELPTGVILLDGQGRVVHFNQAEEKLAGRARASVIGKEFFTEVAPCMNVRELGGRFEAAIGRAPIEVTQEFSFAFPFAEKPREVVVRMRSFESEGLPFATLIVDDVSRQKALDRMRESLGQLLVHDLKNPLAAIVANLGFLAGDARLAATDLSEALDDMQKSSRRLQRMLLTLLDVTALQTGAMPIRRAEIDLSALAASAVAEAQPIARARGLRLVWSASLPLVVRADADLLRRALDNLVENALRHGPPSSTVAVRAATEGDRAMLEVQDEGPGVPAAERERVFERFAQLVSSARESSNRGLGLTFVQLAARAHGGDARLVETPRGALFRIELPCG